MTPRPWTEAVLAASMMVLGGLATAELQAKLSGCGWNIADWPMEVSFLTDSAGHNLFFFVFIVPVLFAIVLAISRHAPDEPE